MITAAAPAFPRLRPPVTGVLSRRDPPPARPSWPAGMKPRSRSTTAVSVARREAVARLDEFVGPKYW